MGGRGKSSGRGGGSTVNWTSLAGTGSAKQVKWAEDIRESAYKTVNLLSSNFDRLVSQALDYEGKTEAKRFAEQTLRYEKQDAKKIKTTIIDRFFSQPKLTASIVINMRRELTDQNAMEEEARRLYRQRKQKKK